MTFAVRVPGHFGEWMQGRLGTSGPVALITMPAPDLGVVAAHRPGVGLALHGAGLEPARARSFLARLRLSIRGQVVMRARVAPGLGTGVSTASLVALARLAGWTGPAATLARACVAVEGASDPLIFSAPERLLWASRRGEVLAALPALPAHVVVGGFWGGPVRTRAADEDFPDIADLVARWESARDLADFAALSSESAARCLAKRGPADDPTERLATSLGALGWTIAHTGAARGLIFAPGTVPAGAAACLRAAGLRGVMQFRGGTT